LKIGRTEYSVFALNISGRGVFVQIEAPVQPRQLVKMRLAPANDESLELMAMTIWQLPRGNPFNRPGGVGFQFYGLDREQARTLSRLVARAAQEGPAAGEQRPLRRHPRHAVALRVRPESFDKLMELYTRDVSAGGMYVETPTVLEIGQEVVFEVIHPQGQRGFRLNCLVKHVGKDPPGLGLEFVGLDAERLKAFYGFVTSHVEELEVDELELVDDDDPKLA
jgi:Tfp pilus assembly protein PilZ